MWTLDPLIDIIITLIIMTILCIIEPNGYETNYFFIWKYNDWISISVVKKSSIKFYMYFEFIANSVYIFPSYISKCWFKSVFFKYEHKNANILTRAYIHTISLKFSFTDTSILTSSKTTFSILMTNLIFNNCQRRFPVYTGTLGYNSAVWWSKLLSKLR